MSDLWLKQSVKVWAVTVEQVEVAEVRQRDEGGAIPNAAAPWAELVLLHTGQTTASTRGHFTTLQLAVNLHLFLCFSCLFLFIFHNYQMTNHTFYLQIKTSNKQKMRKITPIRNQACKLELKNIFFKCLKKKIASLNISERCTEKDLIPISVLQEVIITIAKKK